MNVSAPRALIATRLLITTLRAVKAEGGGHRRRLKTAARSRARGSASSVLDIVTEKKNEERWKDASTLSRTADIVKGRACSVIYVSLSRVLFALLAACAAAC